MCDIGYYLPSGTCDHCNNKIVPAPASPATPTATKEGKLPCFCINSDAEGMGTHINSRQSALDWFAAYLDNMSDGDMDEVVIRRRDKTQAEIDALPEQ